MKRKIALSAMLVCLLAIGLALVGCDNGTTSVSPINPPYDNIPTLDNYDAIFAGENHTNRENFGVYLKLMKYYYSLGVRNFAEESGYGSTLLLQYYIDTGNEECLEVILRNLKGSAAYTQERYNFYKELYKWNSKLSQKIKLHGFDVEHQVDSGKAAIFQFVLKKYNRIEGIPGITTPGTPQDLVNDFKNNKGRYSSINAEDLKLMEKLIANIEQGNNYYAKQHDDTLRENYMIGNFREILNNTKGRKLFATMGANHASLNGQVDGPSINFTMASVLKNETRIASIVLRQQADPNRWQYIVRINENLKTTPFNSTYTGNWPYSNDGGVSVHSPVITKFVVGITLADSDAGKPEKTVFNKGDHFYYGFRASDSKGDWKKMVHNMKVSGQNYDLSWDFTNDFIGGVNIGTNGGYPLNNSGAYEMTWYILDQAGNKSNVITRTITVN